MNLALQQNLFDFEPEKTVGETLHFKFLELFVVCKVIQYTWEWGFYILRLRDVVLPIGLARYIDVSIMLGNPMPLVSAALITVICSLAFFRLGSKWFYLAALILLHLQYVTRFSSGGIQHSSNFVGMSLMGFAVGVAFFSVPKEQMRFIWGFIFFFIGLAYTSSALCKIIGSGVTWVDGRHLWLWIAEKGADHLSKTGQFEMNWLQRVVFTNLHIATLFLLLGWLTEFFGFLFWWKKMRPFIAIGALCLHFGIYFSMNIYFSSFIYQLLIIGFPWAILLDRKLPSGKQTPTLKKWLEVKSEI